MLVNATSHPGPALWQGVMLLLVPMLLFGMSWREGKYFKRFASAYAAIGVALMVVILSAA